MLTTVTFLVDFFLTSLKNWTIEAHALLERVDNHKTTKKLSLLFNEAFYTISSGEKDLQYLYLYIIYITYKQFIFKISWY